MILAKSRAIVTWCTGLLALGAPRAAAQTSVGGVVYVQYNYQNSDTANHVNNFDVTRSYLNVTGRFTGGVATRVTADVFTNANIPGSRALRLKYAFATWTPENSPLTFKLGQMHTPWLDWEEALWDYRMQGQMAIERNGPPSGGGYLSSSDFGIGVDGKWNADQFHFQAGVYNGENYNGALGDQRKDLMARASYRLLPTDDGSRLGGLRLTAYGQYGKPTGGGERQRYIGMLSYRTMGLTLAAQYGITRDSTTGAAGPAGQRTAGRVISAFSVYHFPQTRFSLIARYDLAKQNASFDSTRTKRIIAGASYQLSPNLRLLGDIDFLSYPGGFTETAAQHAAKQTAFFHAMFTF